MGTAASRHADSRLVAVIQAAFSVIMPAVMVVATVGKKPLVNDRFGIAMAVLSGLVIGLFVWAMVKKLFRNQGRHSRANCLWQRNFPVNHPKLFYI